MEILMVIERAAWGALGGVVYAMLWYRKRSEWYEAVKRIVLGAVVGVLFSQTGFPNSVNTFVAGYFSIDALEYFIMEYKKRQPQTLPPPPPPNDQGEVER